MYARGAFGAVNTQGFVWILLCVICNIFFIHSLYIDSLCVSA